VLGAQRRSRVPAEHAGELRRRRILDALRGRRGDLRARARCAGNGDIDVGAEPRVLAALRDQLELRRMLSRDRRRDDIAIGARQLHPRHDDAMAQLAAEQLGVGAHDVGLRGGLPARGADRAEHRHRQRRARDEPRGQPIGRDVQRRCGPRTGRIDVGLGRGDVVAANERGRRTSSRGERVGERHGTALVGVRRRSRK
jgi:hypothetical protein